MHGSRLRSTASVASSSATPARRPKTSVLAHATSVSPSRTSYGHGAVSGATTSSVAGGRGRSTSPSTQLAGQRVAEDAATVVSGSAVTGHSTGGQQQHHHHHYGAGAASPSVTGVSLSHFANDGERHEPNTYDTSFAFTGAYAHTAVSQSTATLWCANAVSGAIDLYSSVSGQFIAAVPPLHEALAARRAELSELPLNSAHASATVVKGGAAASLAVHGGHSTALTPRSRGLVGADGRRLSAPALGDTHHHHHRHGAAAAAAPTAGAGGSAAASASVSASASVCGRVPEADVRASAMHATAAHVWVGYTDGSIAIFDALLLRLVTVSCFHTGRLVAIAALPTGQMVSASTDGLLVLWDTEQAGLEAVTRVSVLRDVVRDGAGPLCAMVATASATRVCCGFESGDVYSVVIASRPHEQTPPQALRGHHGRVNDMAVVRDILFTAAEDNSVCAWYCGSGTDAGDTQPASMLPTHAGRGAGHARVGVRLLKRIAVHPCVRGLLAEGQTGSVWVAYADGVLERWSANPDDDYGVEEVVKAALAPAAGEGGVRTLLSLGAVQTMQWLALSSNGVNKVWYGHKNTTEINLAHSIAALAQVVEHDTEDAAAWRERVHGLRQRELQRKERYVCILDQLSEQRVLLRYYDTWKRALLFCGARRKRLAAVADTLATRARVRLLRYSFGQWATFYDGQQRHMRGYVLAMALSRATEQQQLQSYLLRWQSFFIQRRARRTAERGARVLARMRTAAVLGHYFHRWRAAAAPERQRHALVSAEQLSLLACKAQRQVLQRVLRRWMSYHISGPKRAGRRTADGARGAALSDALVVSGTSALSRFAAHYARLQEQRRAAQVLQIWRRWTQLRARRATLAAVTSLREQQHLHDTRQRFFLRWRQRVHVRHVAESTRQLAVLEVELRRAEAEHGDIFEKLQLQRQVDLLLQRQTTEEANVALLAEQLAAAQQTCDDARAGLPPQRQQQQQRGGSDSGGGGGSSSAEAVGLSGRLLSHATSASPLSQTVVSAMSRGHMSANAAAYRSMVDQQRLSPIVLAHMPAEEAMHHIVCQLKGNVLNVYTDLALFRQVKDRRRGGTTAVAILLESFGEVKRLVVSTVRGGAANATSAAAARLGGRATRWPLSMDALDCIPVHHCAAVLAAIKTLVVAYDLLLPDDMPGVHTTCEEVIANADWIFLIARACYLRRKPVPPANNRQSI